MLISRLDSSNHVLSAKPGAIIHSAIKHGAHAVLWVLLGFSCLLTGLAHADVGLPTYDGPMASFPSPEPALPATRPISSHSELSCSQAWSDDQPDSTLDFAPAGDFRKVLHQDDAGMSIQIPLFIQGKHALLRTGKSVSSATASLRDGRLVLLGNDKGFFHSLQDIRPNDRLLIHTRHTLRQYHITRVRLTHSISHEVDAAGESLSLVACYPFQPVGSKPIFYELRAQPLSAPGYGTISGSEQQPQTLVSF